MSLSAYFIAIQHANNVKKKFEYFLSCKDSTGNIKVKAVYVFNYLSCLGMINEVEIT